MLNLFTGHRAITGVVIRLSLIDLIEYRPADFHGNFVEFFFDGVSTVMPRTSFDYIDLGIRNQLQYITGFQANFLHAQMAGSVVAHLA